MMENLTVNIMNLNQSILSSLQVIAMIETADAIKNLDDILDVEGLDGAFIGQKMNNL